MNSLSLNQAQAIISEALAAARDKGYKPMGVVVADAAAQETFKKTSPPS